MRRIKNILFFALLAVGLAISSGIATEITLTQKNVGSGRDQSMIGIFREKKNTIDVLVLGDSESYTSVSPMKLWQDTGIASYICGQSGQKIQETYYMLRRVLKTQSPKLLILETDVMFPSQNLQKEIQNTLTAAGGYYLPVFQFHNIWKTFFSDSTAGEYFKGFTIRNACASYDGGEYMKETQEKNKISLLVRLYMNKILKICRDRGIEVLLVSVPSPENYNYKKRNALSDYAKKQRISYLDLNLNNVCGIDWKKDSLDKGDHLNISGAHKVTGYLGRYLEQSYALPDHRKDKDYQEWNTMAGDYQRRAEEAIEKILPN